MIVLGKARYVGMPSALTNKHDDYHYRANLTKLLNIS